METHTDQLKELYAIATDRKKALFRFYMVHMALALFSIVAISLVCGFEYQSWIIVTSFLLYVLCSTLVAIMAFFNDSYYDINESLKKEQDDSGSV